ncbi:sensor histidine kinase [Flavicella sediminum]|uniref:sensor histidine kinase n=1 Tax=Flavicella sediminum TaxID=2585141 RepID=UPI001122ABA2|nr:GAF domain-containing sensor histidine kinase [Flavicella sediminum]
MIAPTTPKDEKERLKSLDSFKILETLPEKEYDNLTRLASQICGTPIALISLITEDKQWFKSHHGLDATETPREFAFCAHAINTPDKTFVIPDSRKDERFHDNPLVVNDPNVIFYAGAPLNTPDGYSLGTLCVIDHKPNELTKEQLSALEALAEQVISQFLLRKNIELLEKKNEEANLLNKQLNTFAHSLTHDIKTPIRGIQTIASWLKSDYETTLDKQANDWIDIILSRTDYMDTLATGMLDYSKKTNENIIYSRFNIETLLKEIKDNFPSKNFQFDFMDANFEIEHSEVAFLTIFQNLISNSIKYGDQENGIVKIAFAKTAQDLEIIYEDNGPGIPNEFREKVFLLFETLGSKNENSAGIGLTTVKGFIDRLKGSIKLIDRKDKLKGVCMQINIPLIKEEILNEV